MRWSLVLNFFQVLGPRKPEKEESLHHIYKCLYQCTEKGESCTLLTSLACTLGLPMHCLAAYYSELAPSTCTFANQLHCAVALLHLPNVLLSGLGDALLEAAHCTVLAREQSVGVVWMQQAAMPARNSVWIISHCRPRHSSSIAMQHNAMLPTHKAAAAPHLHMLLLLRHRHQLQHEADTACQTAGRLRMGLQLFEIDQ